MKALIPTLFCLAATILLVLATITVPIRQSFYFLEATVSREDFRLGALGYCVGSQCSNVSVGYDIRDAATLIGTSKANSILSEAATSVLRGLTYTLVLHPVAAGLAALAMLLAILSHCAVGMGCLGTFVAGLATTVSLAAFAIDLALFTIIKKRVQSGGGTAAYGSAIWFVLAAAICLILAQFAFCCACCGSRNGGGGWGGGRKRKNRSEDEGVADRAYGDRMRMDAYDAEAARKARANGDGTGRLPQFAEYEHEVPLKNDYEDAHYARNGTPHSAVGYAYDGVDATHGGSGSQAYHQQQNVGASRGDDYDSNYVPGVGPAYGNGAGVGSGAAAAAAAVGAGAAGAAYAHHHSNGQDAYGHAQSPDEYADYGQGHGYGHDAGASGYGVSSSYQDPYNQSHQDGYGQDAYGQSQHQQYESAYDADQGQGHHDYAPSVTSGYAMGGPSTLAMPQPMPAASAANLARQATPGASGTSRPAHDDGFGVSALEASAAAAAGGAAYGHYQNHRQHSGSEAYGDGSYYDAQAGQGSSAGYDQHHGGNGGGLAASESMTDPNQYQQHQQHPEEWQHSTRTADLLSPSSQAAAGSSQHHYGSGDGLTSQPTGEVPSYDYAIGAISPDEERARSQAGYTTSTNYPSRPNTRGPLPIPGSLPAPTSSYSNENATPGYDAGNSGYGNGYPREKY